jgi:hypothetical protein
MMENYSIESKGINRWEHNKKTMRRSRTPGVWVLVILVLTILVLALSSGCVAPPREDPNGGGDMTGTPTKTTVPTAATPAIIDTQFLTPATPYVTPTMTAGTPRPVVTETTVERTKYQNIYYNNLDMNYQPVAYSYDLSDPPMIIEFCIFPEMITRNIWYESRYKDKDDVTVRKTYISQSAWFEVMIRDKSSGEIVAREGFGKTYSVDTRKTITIRSSGQYLIEFTGNDVSAVIQIRIPLRQGDTGEVSKPLVCPS